MKIYSIVFLSLFAGVISVPSFAGKYVFKAGHESLAEWKLSEVTHPEDNMPSEARIELGKMLFFDPRLSRDGNMSCASCHSPMLGWSDGLATGSGFKGKVLGRASPTIINTAYNSLQMWDGRKKTLEDQAMGPMQSNVEMNTDIPAMINWLRGNKVYSAAFDIAYPGEKIDEATISKAISSFERTIVSKNSPFDAWIAGDKKALSKQQIRGFKLFVDPGKGNCAVCHSGANFVDNGFHNIGLESFANNKPDLGRYAEKPVKVLKGAFKTPTLRDVAYTAPYFHDGSAATLEDVIEHYAIGGVVKTNISREMKALSLTRKEKQDLVAFLESLSSPKQTFTLPVLP